MLMTFDDPLGADDPQALEEEPSAPRAPRFAVSEGAGKHVGFWLAVLGIMAILALVALFGFGIAH